jgi:hypothetical protein
MIERITGITQMSALIGMVGCFDRHRQASA